MRGEGGLEGGGGQIRGRGMEAIEEGRNRGKGREDPR